MVRQCIIRNCGNVDQRDGKRLFRVPKLLVRRAKPRNTELSRRRQRAWFEAIGRNDLTPAQFLQSWICEDHFVSGQPAKLNDEDNPDWTPIISLDPDPDFEGWLGIEELGLEVEVPEVQVHEVLVPEDTSEARLVGDEEPICDPGQNLTEDSAGSPQYSNKNTQTDVTGESMDMLDSELQRLHEEVLSLKNQVNKLSIDESAFQSDDSKTKYFTGLPAYDHLMSVFELVSPHIRRSKKSPLSKFQHFILTVIKLRLNLHFKHLAYQFGISASFASGVFYSCISVMYYRLKNFVRWPDREELNCRTPASFVQAFGDKVTVIIDCFEVAIEKPANVLAQAECWSQYKHHYTVKYLIAISPQGAVSFISEAWGGRTSDQYLTQNCGLLDNLKPNDLILADRGFTIKETVQFLQAQIKVPAFTKGLKQLSPFDVEETRKLASVRIHVERVIGAIKQKFTILEGELPISVLARNGSEVTPLDQIVTVSCALFNLCPSIVNVE